MLTNQEFEQLQASIEAMEETDHWKPDVIALISYWKEPTQFRSFLGTPKYPISEEDLIEDPPPEQIRDRSCE